MPTLIVPLHQTQIDAAQRLYNQLRSWRATNTALHELRGALPGFDLSASLIKVAAINQLYGTQVYAVVRMAEHISAVLNAPDRPDDSVLLVERIAALPATPGGRVYRHFSFASKFAHFFIDTERYPIYDRFAVLMVNYHLIGRPVVPDPPRPYALFVERLSVLRELADLHCTTKTLDAYLWLAGLYRELYMKGSRAKINVEVRDMLLAEKADLLSDLTALLPETERFFASSKSA
jgi:hypothetical protein